MNIDKKQIEYVVGIDLGHGETSAAFCPLQWDEENAGLLEDVKDFEMYGASKVIPSAITLLDDGNAYIGNEAFHLSNLKKASVNVCFKKKPQDINGEKEKLMIRYMQEVYLRIKQNYWYRRLERTIIVIVLSLRHGKTRRIYRSEFYQVLQQIPVRR